MRCGRDEESPLVIEEGIGGVAEKEEGDGHCSERD